MVVLDVERRVYKSESRRHLNFNFNVNIKGQILKVFFSYTPAIMKDRDKSIEMIREGFIQYLGEVDEARVNNHLPLRNFMTISIDSPIEALGTAHRHLKEQNHFISADKSTRGFFTSEIMEGEWNITVSVNAIVTDYVDMSLKAVVE